MKEPQSAHPPMELHLQEMPISPGYVFKKETPGMLCTASLEIRQPSCNKLIYHQKQLLFKVRHLSTADYVTISTNLLASFDPG